MAQIWQEFTDAIKWDRWARAQTDSNFLLAWNWGQAQKDQGYTIRRRGLVDDRGRIKGAYTATTIKARRGRYMTIEGGPQIKYDDESVWQSFIDDVRTIGQAAGAVFIRVRPPLDLNEKNQRIFRDAGWKPAPIHLGAERIGWLDLTQSDQQLWANMSQSRRRQIRRSQKADITISRHQTLAVALEFARIHRQHSVRQEYIAFSQRKLTKQFAAFAQADQAVIYKASHQETVLALNIVFFFGDQAAYHYGVSTTANDRFSAAPLLHLEAVADSRRRGHKVYNLWGIVAADQTDHRFFGVSQFKRSLGAQDRQFLPTHDLVLKPILYKPIWLLESARRRRRHL